MESNIDYDLLKEKDKEPVRRLVGFLQSKNLSTRFCGWVLHGPEKYHCIQMLVEGTVQDLDGLIRQLDLPKKLELEDHVARVGDDEYVVGRLTGYRPHPMNEGSPFSSENVYCTLSLYRTARVYLGFKIRETADS